MSERTRCRMRITFCEEDALKYISHLDLLRAWERILRRARLPVAYSQGFNPHPKITIAMPLPVGCTGEREVVDVILGESLSAEEMIAALEPALPVGISVVAVEEVPFKGPALPSVISHAVYRIALDEVSENEVEGRVAELMAQDSHVVEFRRKTYDLRPLIGALALHKEGDAMAIEATLLRDRSGRIGRPDVLLEALGLSAYARRIHRTRIVFELTTTRK